MRTCVMTRPSCASVILSLSANPAAIKVARSGASLRRSSPDIVSNIHSALNCLRLRLPARYQRALPPPNSSVMSSYGGRDDNARNKRDDSDRQNGISKAKAISDKVRRKLANRITEVSPEPILLSDRARQPGSDASGTAAISLGKTNAVPMPSSTLSTNHHKNFPMNAVRNRR